MQGDRKSRKHAGTVVSARLWKHPLQSLFQFDFGAGYLISQSVSRMGMDETQRHLYPLVLHLPSGYVKIAIDSMVI